MALLRTLLLQGNIEKDQLVLFLPLIFYSTELYVKIKFFFLGLSPLPFPNPDIQTSATLFSGWT